MLQRAASNAYSWWWASHIRTTQSKWLDSNLQEMEEKVTVMIKLIEADADSFAKKAELYFRRRPELINYVEEVYRQYKALADKFDRISKELHKANHTIATAFPDQVPLAPDDDDDGNIDDDSFAKAISAIDPSNLHKTTAENPQSSPASKKEENLGLQKAHHRRISSHVSKEKAQQDIDRLQKEILVLQTEKEFVKSSYQNGLAKYLDIERKISEMQEEICSLQDAFNASAIIEDNDARALMAATAIKSCEDSLTTLHEQQRISMEEAQVESERIKGAKEKLKALKIECGQSQAEAKVSDAEPQSTITKEEDICALKPERIELQSICQKLKEHFEISSEMSVVELAEKIDELVDKVINLELTVSSQTAQIDILRSETDGLQKNIQNLEEEKTTLIDGSNVLTDKLKQTEEELQRIQLLEKSVQDENGIIQTHFAEACHSFNDLSEKLQSPKHMEQVLGSQFSNEHPMAELKEEKNLEIQIVVEQHAECNIGLCSLPTQDGIGKINEQGHMEEVDVLNFHQLLLSGVDCKEKVLLSDCTSIIQNYKETKQRLSELEKIQEHHQETMAEIKELKIANAMKDEEIRILTQKLSSLQPNINENTLHSYQKSENHIVVPTAKQSIAMTETSHAEGIKLNNMKGSKSSLTIEEKLRADIDNLLEENLNFWLRFSTSYHQIQKHQTTFLDMQGDIEKLDVNKSKKNGAKVKFAEKDTQHEAITVQKKLRELNTELQVWLEKNALLKGELQCRFSSICNIQDVISRVPNGNESQEGKFSAYQAAKFQGEILNMKLENSKVAKELQAGLDHVRGLQVEVGRALTKLREFELSTLKEQNNTKHSSKKTRVPLRTFLFGTKPKKPSIFSCTSPAMQKKHSDLRSGSFG